MKRVALFGLSACVVIAAAVWLAIPLYAQHRFEAALDEYFAGRDAAAGYQDAKYDHWAKRATVGEFTDVLGPLPGGATLTVTVTDIVVEGVHSGALQEAADKAAGETTVLADSASWGQLSVRSADGEYPGTLVSEDGRMESIAVTRLNGSGPPRLGLASVDLGALGQTRFQMQTDAGEVSVRADTARLSSLSGGGIGQLSVEGLAANSTFESDGKTGQMKAAWGTFSASGIKREPSTIVERLEQSDMTIDFSMPGIMVPVPVPAPAAGTAGAASGAPEPKSVPLEFKVTYGGVVVEKLVLGDAVIRAYPALFEASDALGEAEPSPDALAAWAESLIAILEQTQQTGTGAELMVLTALKMDFGELQQQTVERITVSGQRGLELDRMEVTGQEQTDALGNRFAAANMVVSGIDFSELPAYLRELLGTPVTAQALEEAGERFQSRFLAGDLPVFNYGNWVVSEQAFQLAGKPSIDIGQMALEPLVIDEGGRVKMAVSMTGFAVPLDSLPSQNPNAQLTADALRAQGLESLSVGFDITSALDLEQGTFALEDVRLSVDNLARVSLDAKASGVRFAEFASVPPEQRAQAAMISTALDGVALSLRDEGLRRLVFSLMGRGQGATPEQVAQALSVQAQQAVASLGTERAVRLGATAAQFIQEGGSLRLASQAAQPVPVIRLLEAMQRLGPAGILDLLRLEARTER